MRDILLQIQNQNGQMMFDAIIIYKFQQKIQIKRTILCIENIRKFSIFINNQYFRFSATYLGPSRILITLALVPMLVVLLNAQLLFDFLGFDPLASQQSQIYIRLIIPALYLLGLVDSNRRLLSCMGFQNGPMVIQIGTTVMHIFWCWLLTDQMGMEIRGTAIATCITNLLNLVILHVYTIKYTDERLREIVGSFPSKESFIVKGLLEYMKLGLPSIGMVCLEWWSFEIMTLFAAYISLTATASQIILLNTAVITFMPALGLQYGGSTLIGQQIGKQNIAVAKRLRKILQLVGYCVSISIGLFIYFGRFIILDFYTTIEYPIFTDKIFFSTFPDFHLKYFPYIQIDEVKDASEGVLKFLAFFHQLDAAQCINCGVLRGLGKFNQATVMAVLSYYVISLPMEYLIALHWGYGLIGLWYGQVCGSIYNRFREYFLIINFIVSCVKKRLQEQQVQSGSSQDSTKGRCDEIQLV